MKGLSRRDFVKLSAMGVGAAVVSNGITGCGLVGSSVNVKFLHGVASGDPLQDRIIIWTRVTPEEDADIAVTWEVAEDSNFDSLIHLGSTIVSAKSDYTLKVDVRNLNPGQKYYYRFKSKRSESPIGEMKTLGEGTLDQVKLAVMSCSNYPTGFFNVYAEAAKRTDLDAVLHLGDYIYEYANGGFASDNAAELGREIPADNDVETLSLDDYRKRYALYRTDTDLQFLHQLVPFIVVWDDHEITNDTWKDGAENHNDGEGDFTERKLQALQAYFEWMPIRPASENDEETIYRQFDFGSLVSLYMLDTRIVGRDQQLDYANYTDPTTGAFNAPQFIADVSDQNRTLMGQDQLAWLQQSMAVSNSTWQVLGQQVLMGKMNIPAELLQDPTVVEELVSIQLRLNGGDPTVTPQEQARVLNKIPYNLDAWDGYAYEREVILGTAKSLNKNLVVLAGDTHNAWANNVVDQSGEVVAVEFATSSVTSPGLSEFLGLPNVPEVIQGTEFAYTTLIDGLQYCNISQRGFMVVTFTADKVNSEWVYVDTITSKDYSIDETRGKTLSASIGSNLKIS